MAEIVSREDALFEQVASLIEEARRQVKTAVNTAMVYTYYGVGGYIVEDEQQGHERAEYGKTVLKNLSVRLTDRYGQGWSVETLDKCRKFYRIYSGIGISSTLSTKSKFVHSVDEIADRKAIIGKKDNQRLVYSDPKFTLSWSHYLVLMRIENPDERSFYELECRNQNWSVRQLQRQYNSSLYERLALSRNKDEVMPKSYNNMDMQNNDTYRRVHFAVMAIESGAKNLGISGKDMHDRLQRQGLIHNRLFKRYEELHTQSLQWVAEDISETLLNWEAEEHLTFVSSTILKMD